MPVLVYGFWSIVAGILLVLTITSWQMRINQQRMIEQANRFLCIVCGQALGAASLDKADRAKRDLFQKIIPNHIPRLGPMPDAICAGCGLEYAYDSGRETLVGFQTFRID